MTRIACLAASTAALAVLGLCVPPSAGAQAPPPQSWLFGAWTGGLFPPPSAVSPQECMAQPVVIFTRDIVMRVVITDQLYTQRLVETARVTAGGVEFRFSPTQASQSGPFGLTQATAQSGFGCESPDALHVRRISDNEISFPGCTDFTYPLVRCPAR